MQLVDFHCHLDLYPDFTEVIKNYEQKRIFTLAVTTTPRAWLKNNELTKYSKYIQVALGYHPQLVDESWRKELEIWIKHLPETKFVGEVGIDGSTKFKNTLVFQKQVFKEILIHCANAENKILSVHSLNSSRTVLDLIEEYLPQSKGRVVLHWFTGTIPEAKKALKLGCYFSINPRMLNTKKGQELLKTLPIDKLLTETDGPFVKINISDTIRGLAIAKHNTVDFISKQISNNFHTLINTQLLE